MAKATTTNKLTYTLWFTDGDDRTLSIENPRQNLAQSDFATLNSLAQQAFVGDKEGAPCKGIKTAKYVAGTTTELEVTAE